MSTGAIIGIGVLVVMVCCSSSSAAMMMGGDDNGSGTGGSGGSTGGSGGSTTPSGYSLRDAQTPANDWGEGNIVYLDRHTVDCDDDGLNQFKLGRPQEDQINYSYKCLEGINSPANINKDTGANDWGEGNSVYLDRHTVDCGDKPIARFVLVRPTEGEIRYDYTCNSKTVSGACRDANTGWNEEGEGNSVYLDRHDAKCNADEVITRFNLVRDGQGKFRYDYKCCKM